jgi:hypothetical protein
MAQEIHFVLTDPGIVGFGMDKKIPPGGCSLSSLKGSYAPSMLMASRNGCVTEGFAAGGG